MAEGDLSESPVTSAVETTAAATKKIIKEGAKKALEGAANTIIPGSGTIAKKALELLSAKGIGGGKDESLRWVLVIGGIFVCVLILIVTAILNAFTEVGSTVGAIASKSSDVIFLSKTVTPVKIANTDLNNEVTFTYNLSIVALKTDLSNISITKDEFYIYRSDGSSEKTSLFTTPSLVELNHLLQGVTITHNNGFNFQFTINLPQGIDLNKIVKTNLKNSLVSNTLDLQAFIAGGTISKTVSATAVITIGDWPNCFYFSDEHDSWGNEKTAELKAINLLMTYPRYRAGLCQNPQRPIKLILDTTSFGDECEVTGDSTIIIRKLCLGGEANRFYSLAHESGHIYSKRNSDVYIEFINYFRDVIVANGENYLCSYRGTKTPSEDFAETIAVYLTNKNFANRPYNTCISSANPNGWINLRDNYPYHYSFAAKGYFD